MWKVCPFGLSTSPAAMVYVLLTVSAGKLGKGLWLYMDDLSIGSSTWPDHLASIEDVLQTLVKNSLSANPTKCQWVYSNLPFGGFLIGADGNRMDSRKIKIIEKLSPPRIRKGCNGLLDYLITGVNLHGLFSTYV